MEISEKIKGAVELRSTPEKIRQIAKSEVLKTLKEGAVDKLLKGLTTVDEIVRVTGIFG